jgi:hypothetical protein
MGTRLTEIVVDCHDPGAQAAFWAAALGYHVVRSEIGQVEIGPWEREPADLAERVLELGARRAGVGQGQVPWAVLADPEGNEFCVLGSLDDDHA